MYLGRGWQTEPLADVVDERGRWLTGDVSEIYFDVAARELRFRAFGEKSGVVLKCELNGRTVGAIELKKGWNDYQLQLPVDTSPMNICDCCILYRRESDCISSIEIR